VPAARPAFGAYLDISVSTPDLASLAGQTGLKHVILSFVLAKNGGCEPAWGGTDPLDTPKASIDAFHAAGGSVTIATGGADGPYLEKACGSAADLADAYTKILDATGTNLLDIDVEHDVQIDKVIDALQRVHRARGTDITLTLPVDLAGLGPGQLDLVRRAAATNLAVTVNIMDMDFHAKGNWGKAMVAAAETMLSQLRKVYPTASEADRSRKLGITIMIGRNDNGVITQPADAQTVLDFAKSHGIGRLGIWSLGRDRGTCATRVAAQPDCSGTAQADYQYTKQLAVFNGPTPA
jgi:chitinase